MPSNNPYTDGTMPDQVDAEQGILIDPVTGLPRSIGGRIDRIILDPSSGQYAHQTTHLIAPSADGEQLLFPFNQTLYVCAICHTRPLTVATRCTRCQRYLCGRCRIPTKYGITCRWCLPPLWKRLLAWLANV